MREKSGFTLIELLVVIVIIAILAALLLPAIAKALCSGRQGAAEHLIDNLTQSAKNYEIDQNVFPNGTGAGSDTLAAALSAQGPKNLSYFEFQPGMLDPGGHVRNPVWGDVEILYYRRNFPNPTPAARNKSSFDIWGRDCNGTPGGGAPSSADPNLVCNWE